MNRSKIYAASKFLFYSVGGAEKSTIEVLKKYRSEGHEVVIIGFDCHKKFISDKQDVERSDEVNISKIKITGCFEFNRFFYLEYFLNRNKVKKVVKKLEGEAKLITYGMYAPVFANNFSGECTIYLRSETDLGILNNYYSGIKRLLKLIYLVLEYPFFKIYLRDLKKSFQNSKVIANSNYIKKRLFDLYQKESAVEYPLIDTEWLKKEYFSAKAVDKKGVLFIGDNIFKGLPTFIEIAKKMPEETFYIASRFTLNLNLKNVVSIAWSKDVGALYQYAKLVIVPSLWEEAYGRVGVEAMALGIPVLVSNRGGLPESVNYDSSKIIDDYLNADEWVDRIKNIV